MSVSRDFSVTNITLFAEHYVAGDTGTKQRAHTSVPPLLSALSDHAKLYNVPFPHAGTAARLPIKQFIRGLKNRYPHEPEQDLALTLRRLRCIAKHLPDGGVSSCRDLWRVSLPTLTMWARIVVMHDACIRSVGTKLGMQVKDVSDCGTHIELTVGRRPAERKIKQRRARVVPIGITTHCASAGYVCRVFMARVHSLSGPNACLFPAFRPSGVRAKQAVTWAAFCALVQSLCRSAGIRGKVGPSSFRAGGATDYFSSGATMPWVKMQGGWLSEAYQRYNRPSPEERSHLGNTYQRVIIRLHKHPESSMGGSVLDSSGLKNR